MTIEELRALDEQTQAAYHALFTSPGGRRVLLDLIAYCHGRKTTFDVNDRAHAFNEGKRDVLMRICEFTNLNLDEIYRLRSAA